MKQAIGTLTLLLIAASGWAQNPATTLKSTQANLQTAQQQNQASSTQASGTTVKSAAATAKPAPHSTTAQATNVKPNAAPAKTAISKSDSKPSAAPNSKPAAVATKNPAAAPKTSAKPSAQVATNHSAPAVQPVKSVPAKQAQAVKTVSAKPAQISIKPATAAKVDTKPIAAKAAPVTAKAKITTPVAPVVPVKVAPVKEVAAVKADVKDINKPESSPKTEAEKADNSEKKETSKYINITGRRDPFISPVVAQSEAGSGCSVGKKCLAIDQISIRGVVKAESGMIAVVVNALDKAYFLRENDPVYNGYVEKITEDSIIFKETYQDKLGKPLTRDVTKRVQAPAV